MNTVETAHTCKNCGNSFRGKYCNACGEKVYTEHDKSVLYIFEEALHFITHFEGNFLTSVKTIFVKPGKLSLDYCNGIRKKYYKPVTMFFFLVVIYLLVPKLFPQGLDMPLSHHEGQHMYGDYVHRMVEAKLQKQQIKPEVLAEHFAHQSHTVSKFMLFIILPICAFILWMLYPLKRRPYFDHFILSTEINAFFLAAFFMLLPLLFQAVDITMVFLARNVFHSQTIPDFWVMSEGEMMNIISVLFFFFCTVCFHRFYGSPYWVSALKAIVFVLLQYMVIFFFYKVALFTVVMWLI